jgi:hypothetical protein
MAKEQWLRSSEWTAEAQREFETKISRSKRKAYHLTFKAGVLAQVEGRVAKEGARALLERVIRDFPTDLADVAVAHQSLAQLQTEDDGGGVWNAEHAEEHYRACIAIHEKLQKLGKGIAIEGGDPRLELAELLLAANDKEKDLEAHDLLKRLEKDSSTELFVEDAFRHAVASARVARRHEDATTAAAMVKRAMDLVDAGHVEVSAALAKELARLRAPHEG